MYDIKNKEYYEPNKLKNSGGSKSDQPIIYTF